MNNSVKIFFIFLLLVSGYLSAQKGFQGKNIYISEGSSISINTEETVTLDSVKGEGKIKIGKAVKKIEISQPELVENIVLPDSKELYVVCVESNKKETDLNSEYSSKISSTSKNLKFHFFPTTEKEEKQDNSFLNFTINEKRFEKNHPMGGGIVLSTILFIHPLLISDYIPVLYYTHTERY